MCSKITKELLKKHGILDGYIEALELLSPYRVDPPDGSDWSTFTVTFVDANHCPGSICALIEGKGFSYFVSGDVRVSDTVIRDCQAVRKAGYDVGYIDSTFYDKQGRWDMMPTIAESIQSLIEFLSGCSQKVAFEFDLLGTEVLLQAVLTRFQRERIGVISEKRFEELEIIYADYPQFFARFVLVDPEACHLRFCLIPRSGKTPRGFVRLRASTQRWAKRIRSLNPGQQIALVEFDPEREEVYLFFSFHSCKREIDTLIHALGIRETRFVVKAIEVQKEHVEPKPLEEEPSLRTRNQRCRRFPFQFSMDHMWLDSLADSQETVFPNNDELDSLTLPTWRL